MNADPKFHPSAGAWHALRRTISRHRAGDFLKTMVVVVPLTLLIWIYAERSSVTDGACQVSIVLVPADQALAPTQPESLSLELRGPRNQITQFTDELGRRTLRVTLPASYQVGENTIEAATLLNNEPTFSNFGVKISKVEPSSLRVRIDRYVENELTVVMRPDASVSLQQVVFDPPKVVARGPESVFNSEYPESNRQIRVDLSNYTAQLNTRGPHRLPAMPLTLPTDGRFTIRPPRVNGSFEVMPSEEETTIDSVTIAVQLPLGLQGKWLVKVHGNALRVPNVRLRGPGAALTPYKTTIDGKQVDPKRQASAILRVKQEDIGNSDVRRAVDFADLEPGITVVGGPYEVEFNLEQVTAVGGP